LFLRLCYSGLYVFYHALSPAFFHWLRLPLPEIRKAHIPKELAKHQRLPVPASDIGTLQQMAAQFQEKISATPTSRSCSNEMHEELQNYKNGFVEGCPLAAARRDPADRQHQPQPEGAGGDGAHRG
jgi:hypothetical protein